MYEVKLFSAEELPEQLREDFAWGSDYSRTLVIYQNGEIVESHSDGGEPEDQTFGRDWKWVAQALRKAYAIGLDDGKAQGR